MQSRIHVFTLPVSFLSGLAVASALTVMFTVLAAVTLLPALLGVFGARVLSRRQRRTLHMHAQAASPAGLWARWAGTVERRPAVLVVVAAVVMLVLAIPVLSLRLGTSDRGNDPSSSTTRQAYDLLADGFGPGFNGPLQLVAQTSDPADVAALRALEAELPGVPNVTNVHRWPRHTAPRSFRSPRAPRPRRRRRLTSSPPCVTASSRMLSAAPRCGSTSAASPRPSPTSPPW